MLSFVSMVAADITKWIAWGPCKVIQLYGFNNNATVDRFIQLHAKPAAAIATGNVPFVKSIWAPAAAAFSWTFSQPLTLPELSIGISDETHETSYNAAGANTGLDMTLVVESDFLVTANTTLTGDLTTGVASKQVWASASGPKKLLRLDVTNNHANNAFILIEASDASSTAEPQPLPAISILDGATKNMNFGYAGVVPFRNDAGTVQKGCTVRFAAANAAGSAADLTGGVYTIIGNADFTVRAIYDNL